MPVLYVHNSESVAGGNKILLTLVDQLRGSRFRPVAILPGGGPMEPELTRRDIPYITLDLTRVARGGRVTSARLVVRIASWMRRQRVRLVHVNDPRYYRVTSVAARWLRVARICHVHLLPGTSELAWAFKIPPHAAITCSMALKTQLIGALPSLPVDTWVALPNAIDVEAVTPPADLAALRERLGLDQKGFVVAIVGAVSERKGHRYFLEMAQQVSAQAGRAEFLVVGDDTDGGRYRRAMEQYARELGVEGRVRFLGFRRDAPDWIAASDLVVLPSLHEGLPVSLMEAHACAKPVVATEVDGIPEIVEDGVTGFLVSPADTAALTKAVLALLSDEALRQRMGVAARARVERLFSARTYARRMERVYTRLLA